MIDQPNITGLIGAAVGILGGAVGTYCSIKHTNGFRERRLMVRASVMIWAALGSLAALSVLLPRALPWIWILFFGLLPLGIAHLNRRQREIRDEEQGVRLIKSR